MTSIFSLTVGPIVGHADTDQARIFGRAQFEPNASGHPRRAFGVLRYRKVGTKPLSLPQFFKMNPNFDLTGIAILNNLQPDTHYEYEVGYFFADVEPEELNPHAEWEWEHANYGRFITASADITAPRDFIFGSCRYLLKLFGGRWFDDRGDKTFRSIFKQIQDGQPLQKLLMVGDQIYADDLNFLAADTRIDEYLERYQDAFTQPHIRKLMSQVSTYMTLDDHEIEDNWPESASAQDLIRKYPAAAHAYQAYQVSHSPLILANEAGRLQCPMDHYYYSFSDGCCDFFVLDTRTERDLEHGFMISTSQLDALFNWLADGSSRAKLVVSSVPFFPDTNNKNNDKWSGFTQQRDNIINKIRELQLTKVIFLSGDVHCSMASELEIGLTSTASQKIYSVISSSFFWPYMHMEKHELNLNFVASAHAKKVYRITSNSAVFSGDNFSRMHVSPEGFKVQVFGRKGSFCHDATFKF